MAVPPAECVVSHDRPRPRMTWHGMPSVRRGRGDVEARRSCDEDEDVRQSRRLLRPPGNGMRKASSRVDRVLASQDPRSFSSRGSPDSRRVEGAMSASGRWRCEVRECRFHLFLCWFFMEPTLIRPLSPCRYHVRNYRHRLRSSHMASTRINNSLCKFD